MKLFLTVLLLMGSFGAAAQNKPVKTRYKVPKYSPSYKRTSRDVGPHPGSKAPAGAKDAVFKRIYAKPAGIRLLVRTNCDTKLGRGELIARARKLTTASGPVVQIDWETVRGDKAAFWVVASASRQVAKLDLKVEDGKYKSMGEKVTPQEHWQVSRLSIGPTGSICVKQKEMTSRQLRVAVVNFLNRFTLDFFRKPSDDFATTR